MDRYAPIPTPNQLRALSDELGKSVDYEYRIFGGLGGTIDVLRLGAGKVVLKRYWLPEDNEEVNPAESEFRALRLAAEHGIPVPEPLWIDRTGLFPERAVLISFLEGKVHLEPVDPLDWATQLAKTLTTIHEISPTMADASIFPILGHDDDHTSEEAVMQHPLGQDLWAKRTDAIASVVPVDRVYVHHDFWPGNTLWVEERLVAVIDWEGGWIGDPALDVAYCALDIRLLGMDPTADYFIEEYRRISGRTLPNFRYWELVALCRPMPDVAEWVPGWRAVGIDISPVEVRRRHREMIEAALRRN